MATIRIGYTAPSLTANPSPLQSPPNNRAIVWQPQVSTITLTGVTISTKNGAPFTGTQPSPQGTNYNWADLGDNDDTYEYIVSANTTDGAKTLDPQIINISG